MTLRGLNLWGRLVNRASGVVASFVGTARAVLTATLIGNANRWRDGYNPLRGLTVASAVTLVESWDRGEFADLMWLYRWIERSDATLSAVLNRREAALTKLDWEIKTIDEDDLPPDVTEADVEAQKEFLRAAYERLDNLREAIAHLALADFRGFSFVEKQAVNGPLIDHLECVDHWNVLRAGLRGAWYYNASGMQKSTHALPDTDRMELRNFVHLTCERHVDFVALFAVLRKALGQKDWAAFVEGFGLNPTIIIGPPGVAQEKAADFQTGAESVAEHSSGYLPNGSDVKYANSEKGQQPFAEYIKAQDADIVLAGTSGKLTMLAESGSGTLAGAAHKDTFDELAKGHAQRISEAFQRDFDRPLLAAEFPGKPVLAYFELCANEETNVGDVVKDVATLATAGYAVKPEQIEEKTGYEVMSRGVGSTEQGADAEGDGTDLTRASDSAQPGGAVTAAAPAGGAVVADTALNGAQVTALAELAGNVAAGLLPMETARTIALAAFPGTPEVLITKIFAPLKSFTPRVEEPAASLTNRAADPVAALRSALKGDLASLARRVRSIAAISDEGIRREKLAQFRAELPGLLKDLNADPAAAAPMAALIERSLAAGASQAEAGAGSRGQGVPSSPSLPASRS